MPKLLLLFVLILVGGSLSAYNLYVAPNGNPFNADGSIGNPYPSIQQAIDHAFDDSLLENVSGTEVVINLADNPQGYQEALSIVYYTSSTIFHNVQDIVIRSSSNQPQNCVLKIPETAEQGILVSGVAQSRLMIQGLSLENHSVSITQHGILLYNDPSIINPPTLEMEKFHIDNCMFNDFPVVINAIQLAYIDTFKVVNSFFNEEIPGLPHRGITMYSISMSDNAVITGNIIKEEDDSGVNPDPAAFISLGRFHSVEFSDNDCNNTAVKLDGSDELVVENNTFINSPLEVGGEIELLCKGNTFASGSELPYNNYALKIAKDTSEQLEVCYNLFFDCYNSIYFDQWDGEYSLRNLNNYIYKNAFIDCEKVLNVRLGWTPYAYPPITSFRDNLYYGSYSELFTITNEYYEPYQLTGNSRIPISFSHFSNGLTNAGSLDLDAGSVSYGNPYISVNSQTYNYELVWDHNNKSPLINTGCPEIDGVVQADPDGTPPDIGARHYPHHHRKYFDRTDGTGIYWLSFPVVDDRSQTDGTYWNELGYLFHDNMYEPDQALIGVHWSYDTEIDKMSYDQWTLQWLNTGHTAEQPKGYKVKFNTDETINPVIVNGFKADPDVTPVAWVEEYLHNGQMQDFVNSIGYFVPETQEAGYALSRYLPRSTRFTYLDYVHTIKTRNWSTYRISEEMNSPWVIDPNTYTLSEGDMVELLLLPGAPEEMYWNTGLHVAPRERPRATAFGYEEKLDYTSLIVEFDPDNLPQEVAVFVDGECKGASVVESTVVDICVYPDEAKSGGEPSIVFYYDGKGAKAAQGWKIYNPQTMVFEDGILRLNGEEKYSYVSFNHKTGDSPVPLVTALDQNYPNPFNPITNISFVLGSDMPVKLDVFNIKGQRVTTLCDQDLPKGKHSIQWSGRDIANRPVASGIYFYRLSSPDGVQTRKMMLMK
ncbi:MAG: T9SS type A sorting domain-containing protein [Candidatus Cloacimonadaceae bacterium]|nr:T9SS type A sorting domain-containing protein [Candidatus Cloacimonadota bacterium]MDD4560017.1 T9SS type A sorting domain-containing protein [Candidatus Cloacimonadota bacterium]